MILIIYKFYSLHLYLSLFLSLYFYLSIFQILNYHLLLIDILIFEFIFVCLCQILVILHIVSPQNPSEKHTQSDMGGLRAD